MSNLFKNTALLIVLLAVVVNCDTKHSGSIDVKGYFMYRCGSNDPMGGVTLTYERGGRSLLSDKTDAYGYFHVLGDYEFRSRKEFPSGDLSIVGNGQNGFYGSIVIMEMIEGKIPFDTIYYLHSTRSILNLRVETNGYTEQDTLFIQSNNDSLPDYKSGDIHYNFKYPGPFADKQILDTIITRLDPHVGYSQYSRPFYYTIKRSRQTRVNWKTAQYPFEPGQKNIPCGCFVPVILALN